MSALEHEKQRVSTLRNKLSKGFQNVPDTADHYVLDGFDGEDISEEDAESLQRFKEIAHKNGLSQEQFNSLLSDFKEAFPYNTEDPVSNSYRDWETDRKSTRLNSSHSAKSRMPSSA